MWNIGKMEYWNTGVIELSTRCITFDKNNKPTGTIYDFDRDE